MSQRSTAPSPGRATIARIIHATILMGLVVAFGVFIFLQGQLATEFPVEIARIIRPIAYVVLIASGVASLAFRGRIPPRRGGVVEDWWAVSLPRAVLVWAIAEGGSLAAMVLGWIMGDTTLLTLAAAAGLAVLFVSRPGRLQSEI